MRARARNAGRTRDLRHLMLKFFGLRWRTSDRATLHVSRTKREFRVLSFSDLAERAKSDPEAQRALSRCRAIEDAGGWPEIRYSDRHGWRIVDLRDASPQGAEVS